MQSEGAVMKMSWRNRERRARVSLTRRPRRLDDGSICRAALMRSAGASYYLSRIIYHASAPRPDSLGSRFSVPARLEWKCQAKMLTLLTMKREGKNQRPSALSRSFWPTFGYARRMITMITLG